MLQVESTLAKDPNERENPSITYEMTSKFLSTSNPSGVPKSETKVDRRALQAASAKDSSKKSTIVLANRSADTRDVNSTSDVDKSDQSYSYI